MKNKNIYKRCFCLVGVAIMLFSVLATFNLNNNTVNAEDTYYENLYPDLVSSDFYNLLPSNFSYNGSSILNFTLDDKGYKLNGTLPTQSYSQTETYLLYDNITFLTGGYYTLSMTYLWSNLWGTDVFNVIELYLINNTTQNKVLYSYGNYHYSQSIIAFILFFTYSMKYDTVVAFTGGLGSGKTYLSVKTALKLLKRNTIKAKIYNFFHRKNKIPMPKLYSSIPVLIKKRKNLWATRLTIEHLLLCEKIERGSVVFIDEIGAWAKQFDFENINLKENFDELIRLFRHYTLGGYLVVNDQCSENIVLYVRRRINTIYNLMTFRKWLPPKPLFFTVRVRNISISEEIKTVEQEDTEDNTTLMIGFMSWYKHYDTYCYSERYSTVPTGNETTFHKFKQNYLLKCPVKRYKKLTTDEETNGVSGVAVGTATPNEPSTDVDGVQ